MSLKELKIVINDIIDDYNLDIILLVGIILYGLYVFLITPFMYVSTTDAVIDGHIINVTSRAGGQIIHSYIMKDQEVRKGDLIMEIDPKDYEAELLKLQTDLDINKEKLKILKNGPVTEEAQQNGNEETVLPKEPVSRPPKYIRGSNNFTNYSKTYEVEDLSQQNLARKKMVLGDAVQNMSETKPAEIQDPKTVIDKTKIDVSNDTVESVEKTIKDIENQKEEVKLLLSSTKIFAPQDGVVAAISIAQGDIVNPADVLCTLTPKQVWVIARVNPEQLSKVQIGQYAEVKIPGYKNRKFKASVTSVDTTSKVYRVKPEEQITQIGPDGNVIRQSSPAYQIKLEFLEDYSDFSLPPETEVNAKIKVQTFYK